MIATFDGRQVHIGGEALLNQDPDYLIFPKYVTAWTDGTPIDADARAEISCTVRRCR